MSLDKQAEIARRMTGSKLSNQEIFAMVRNINQDTKKKICPEIDQMIKDINLPLDKAYPSVMVGFYKMSVHYNIDSAVLFWIYMEWLKYNK
ncbi:hypothetical protein [Desulfoscipio gibsoniae]|uniref:Uncharacterized protein n=1 Tax=Desulfoscipio gibsoniae DSM 7213 TaxID=767817 RepID=R4KRS7_9FIRM|nr:hypothetical protein [Desulfoscipio gibsoniae]AGL03285.1 hypothetical protein Desgi_4006 [Desulfoscipio gibsoniae DSM 7213]